MKAFRIVAFFALLAGPIHAQTLIQSFVDKTPQQKADEALKERSAKEAAKTPPDTGIGTSVDAWGNVRSSDAAKSPASKHTASKSPASKSLASKSPALAARTATSAKPQTKTGTDAN